MTFLDPLTITLILYVLIIFSIGIVASFKIKKMSDFVLAGRNLSGPIAALGAGASDMSGWLLMALPGIVFLEGLKEIWIPIGLIIGAFVNWTFVAKRLRVYTEVARDSLTIPSYFDNRFPESNKILRVVTAIVTILFFTFYASAGFVGCSLLIEKVFHLNYTNALFLSAFIMITYTCIGGFIAVNWVDFFQGILMFFAILIVPFYVFFQLGGIDVSIAQLTADPIYINPWSDMTVISLISFIGWGLGYFGQPHILTRFMAVIHHKEIKLARLICMNWMALALIGSVLTGLAGHIYYSGYLNNPEMVFILLSVKLFNPWFAGILIAAVLSAIMSTITAQLINSASALVEDMYHAAFRVKASQKELVLISRLSVIVIALIAVLLAYNPQSTILNLVQYAWGGLGASFGPVILISLYWKKMTRKAAISGMIVGALTILFWPMLKVFTQEIFKLWEIVPAFLLNVVTIIVVSHFDKKVTPRMLEDFNKVEKILQENI